MNVKKEIWMPHAAHFICGDRCQFHLATYVNGVIVSTVGELMHDAPLREALAKSRGLKIEGKGDAGYLDYLKQNGFEDIGLNRKYETMVFKARKTKSKCCPFECIIDDGELELAGYNDADSATLGHYKILDKWRNKVA